MHQPNNLGEKLEYFYLCLFQQSDQNETLADALALLETHRVVQDEGETDEIMSEIVKDARKKASQVIRTSYVEPINQLITASRKRLKAKTSLDRDSTQQHGQRYTNTMVELFGSWSNMVKEILEIGLSKEMIQLIMCPLYTRISEMAVDCFQTFQQDKDLNNWCVKIANPQGHHKLDVNINTIDGLVVQLAAMRAILHQYYMFLLQSFAMYFFLDEEDENNSTLLVITVDNLLIVNIEELQHWKEIDVFYITFEYAYLQYALYEVITQTPSLLALEHSHTYSSQILEDALFVIQKALERAYSTYEVKNVVVIGQKILDLFMFQVYPIAPTLTLPTTSRGLHNTLSRDSALDQLNNDLDGGGMSGTVTGIISEIVMNKTLYHHAAKQEQFSRAAWEKLVYHVTGKPPDMEVLQPEVIPEPINDTNTYKTPHKSKPSSDDLNTYASSHDSLTDQDHAEENKRRLELPTEGKGREEEGGDGLGNLWNEVTHASVTGMNQWLTGWGSPTPSSKNNAPPLIVATGNAIADAAVAKVTDVFSSYFSAGNSATATPSGKYHSAPTSGIGSAIAAQGRGPNEVSTMESLLLQALDLVDSDPEDTITGPGSAGSGQGASSGGLFSDLLEENHPMLMKLMHYFPSSLSAQHHRQQSRRNLKKDMILKDADWVIQFNSLGVVVSTLSSLQQDFLDMEGSLTYSLSVIETNTYKAQQAPSTSSSSSSSSSNNSNSSPMQILAKEYLLAEKQYQTALYSSLQDYVYIKFYKLFQSSLSSSNSIHPLFASLNTAITRNYDMSGQEMETILPSCQLLQQCLIHCLLQFPLFSYAFTVPKEFLNKYPTLRKVVEARRAETERLTGIKCTHPDHSITSTSGFGLGLWSTTSNPSSGGLWGNMWGDTSNETSVGIGGNGNNSKCFDSYMSEQVYSMLYFVLIEFIVNYILNEFVLKGLQSTPSSPMNNSGSGDMSEWGAMVFHEEILSFTRYIESQDVYITSTTTTTANKWHVFTGIKDLLLKVSFAAKLLTLDAPGDIRRYSIPTMHPASANYFQSSSQSSVCNDRVNIFSEEEIRHILSKRKEFSREAIAKVKLRIP